MTQILLCKISLVMVIQYYIAGTLSSLGEYIKVSMFIVMFDRYSQVSADATCCKLHM